MNEERTNPAHLRALAEGATPVPGDWYVPADAEAAFRAAVSPPVLLALLDRLERVEGALGRMLGTHDGVHAESCNCYEKGPDEDLDVDDTCDCGATETRTRAHAALRGEP
mgnify:CR=1 FL=1